MDILYDVDGNIIEDMSTIFMQIQEAIDSVELKRTNAAMSRSKSSKKRMYTHHVRVSAQDIRAVLFRPLIELEMENPDVMIGRSQFAAWMKIPEIPLSNLISMGTPITINDVMEAWTFAYNRIVFFVADTIPFLNDLATFIDRLLDQLPTAFGNMSPPK